MLIICSITFHDSFVASTSFLCLLQSPNAVATSILMNGPESNTNILQDSKTLKFRQGQRDRYRSQLLSVQRNIHSSAVRNELQEDYKVPQDASSSSRNSIISFRNQSKSTIANPFQDSRENNLFARRKLVSEDIAAVTR